MKTIVVTVGVHGDEPSGVHARQALADEGFVTFGPCNPWGLEHNTRWLENGGDLNRRFGFLRPPEAFRVMAFLEQHPPGLLLDLHEDADSDRPYLIQLDPHGDLGRRIVARLAGRWELHPQPRFGLLRGRDGVLQPAGWMLRLQWLSRRWSLSFYAWQRFACPAFVVEAPGGWELAERVEFHQTVCRTARELFG